VRTTQLKGGCPDVVKVLPPATHKDLRKWKPTAEELEAWIEQKGELCDVSKMIDGSPSENYSHMIERFLIEQDYAMGGKHRLIYHHQTWYIYDGAKYILKNPELLESELREFFKGWEYEGRDVQRTVRPVIFDIKLANELKRVLRDRVITNVPANVSEPCVLNTGKSFDASHVIMFKNGILDVMGDKLMPHSNNLFTTSTLPYDFDPRVSCPGWETAVQEWFDEDEERVALLQEWFGYNLIASNKLQQLMFIYGVSGSGKSTAVYALQQMLGGMEAGNYAVTKADLLANDKHATVSLAGKLARMIQDETTLSNTNGAKVWSVMKQISGQDTMVVRKLYKKSENVELFCRITYSSNVLPVVLDETGSIFRRYNLLEFNQHFEHPATDLRRKLAAESQGIAMWAIEGLERLLKNGGKFTVPKLSKATIAELKLASQPVKYMLQEYFTFNEPEAFVSRRQIYELYKAHCVENDVSNPVTNRMFTLRCLSAMPALADLTHKRNGILGYLGMKITKQGAELLGG
jgi:P4 family phage/plasmid primase-like protien